MGGGGGKGASMPDIPETAPAPEAPSTVDASVRQAGYAQRRQRAAATGRSDTILTSGQGVSGQADTNKKKLLGA